MCFFSVSKTFASCPPLSNSCLPSCSQLCYCWKHGCCGSSSFRPRALLRKPSHTGPSLLSQFFFAQVSIQYVKRSQSYLKNIIVLQNLVNSSKYLLNVSFNGQLPCFAIRACFMNLLVYLARSYLDSHVKVSKCFECSKNFHKYRSKREDNSKHGHLLSFSCSSSFYYLEQQKRGL